MGQLRYKFLLLTEKGGGQEFPSRLGTWLPRMFIRSLGLQLRSTFSYSIAWL